MNTYYIILSGENVGRVCEKVRLLHPGCDVPEVNTRTSFGLGLVYTGRVPKWLVAGDSLYGLSDDGEEILGYADEPESNLMLIGDDGDTIHITEEQELTA